MTEAKLKRIYAETAAEWYLKGATTVCDILAKSLADMPDQNALIPVKDFLAAVAVARNAVTSQTNPTGPQNGAHG